MVVAVVDVAVRDAGRGDVTSAILCGCCGCCNCCSRAAVAGVDAAPALAPLGLLAMLSFSTDEGTPDLWTGTAGVRLRLGKAEVAGEPGAGVSVITEAILGV